MTYIILKDTLGNGLTTFNSSKLGLYDKDQLEEGILAAAQDLLDADGVDSVYEYEEEYAPLVIGDAIVICEIVDTIDGTYTSDYIRHLIVESKIKQSNEEYELYLKLKEKFEK
jgi:hypothetical protein